MKNKCLFCKIVCLLSALGAINWGLVALLNVNLVTKLLGDMTTPAKLVYTLIGLSGIVLIMALFVPKCPKCKPE